jgi:hypothetical protein
MLVTGTPNERTAQPIGNLYLFHQQGEQHDRLPILLRLLQTPRVHDINQV